MEFDITFLDKKEVIQALFAYASPRGMGGAEYFVRKDRGDNVDGLSNEECEILLAEFEELRKGNVRIADYHKGKPMKVNFEKKANGRVLVDSGGYDSRNGKYRFLEAMLNIFLHEDILITKKGYRPYVLHDLRPDLIRPKAQEDVFKYIIKHSLLKKNEYGQFWAIDFSKIPNNPFKLQL